MAGQARSYLRQSISASFQFSHAVSQISFILKSIACGLKTGIQVVQCVGRSDSFMQFAGPVGHVVLVMRLAAHNFAHSFDPSAPVDQCSLKFEKLGFSRDDMLVVLNQFDNPINLREQKIVNFWHKVAGVSKRNACISYQLHLVDYKVNLVRNCTNLLNHQREPFLHA